MGVSRKRPRCVSQVSTSNARLFVGKMLYSKGKLLHSKIHFSDKTINRRLAPKYDVATGCKIEPENLNGIFQTQKTHLFDSNKLIEPMKSRHSFKLIQKTAIRTRKVRVREDTVVPSEFVIMESIRGCQALRTFDEAEETFEGGKVMKKDTLYFLADNDVDTDEEQQSKAVTNCLSKISEFLTKREIPLESQSVHEEKSCRSLDFHQN